MSVAELVSQLKSLDVKLKAEGSRLRIDAPKGVLTDRMRAELAERKQELLEFLRVSQPQDTFVPPIERRVVEGSAPLSFAQERLWFLEQLEPGSAVYNICRGSRLTGQLNVFALEKSLAALLRRHQILRSQFRIIEGRPIQVTAASPEFKLHFTDLRSLKGSTLDYEIRRQIRAEREQRFDFSSGLFLRGALLQIRNNQHILILTTHHIAADAWSMGILTRELWILYDAYANGRPSALQDLAVQYADYAIWQREWLQENVLESQLSYWKEQLKELPILHLPTDHLRPVKQSFRGARQPLSLPESLTKAINELSEREGVTQFMTLLAAFQVLLSRYSGQEGVVVGSPIANRSSAQTEGLIGFFVNTLVLRSDCSGNPSFREFLLRVRDVCLSAYAHQDLPFEKLVEELRPERDLSRNPLFQVMFVLQNTPRRLAQPVGLSIERVDVLPATSTFDLSLYLREREGKLIGFFEYNTDLFEPSTIGRMIGHFQTLLEGIAADPEQPISTLPILTESERHQILIEWNDTAADYPRDSCIHELFEAQVERTPEANAVEFDGKQLTYRELNSQANQLAHYLRRLGIGLEKLVGICIERSIETVVGLLGILKAGGAYVPLDPAYPRERLAFMLKDAQVSVLLTQEKLIEDIGWKVIDDSSPRSPVPRPEMKLVCLDTNWETIHGETAQNIGSEVKPDNLAYVIYTSGSTGQPKGVAIEHRNTVAFLRWAGSIFTPEELRGVLASTSICFDLSIFELFVPLSWGGKVILVENVLQLPSAPGRHQVTLINTVPSAMTELLKINGLPESLRTVNLAGEPLRSDLVEQIYGGTNVNKVYDLYGPSETTTYSTFTLRDSNKPATIGRPIANSRIYILDGSLQPVPVGVTGEILIGGAGVARGYLNRSELTAEMFIADPFSEGQGSRLYRTGDRGCYLPDGNIKFIGRIDNQVKIRGYRIELGEIEVVLTKHPAVKDCVVAVCERESRPGKDLVAYVVPREHSVPSVTELRGYLKENLPEYMIPSSFVVLEALPLMPNGKVDRNRLPRPGTIPPLTGKLATPRNEIEELIAQTWREVLRIEDVGIYDNFFELGGHSLLATQIVARLQEAVNKDVRLRVLFDAPTIAELAEELETIIRDGHAPELPPIVPVPREGPLPLSMNQEHLWQIDQMIPGTHFFNMPYVYRLSGDLNINALQEALNEIVHRHEALRTVFAKIGGRPVQVIRDGSDCQLPVEDLRSGERDDVSRRAVSFVLEEREAPFDLSEGPLLRLKLLRLTDTDSFLLVTIHHIISDYWSMQIFRRELIVLYEAFSKGRPSPLPKLAIQFPDFACWDRRLLDKGLLNNQLDYWKKQLAGPLPLLEFRKGREREKVLSFRTCRQPIEFDETLFTRIKALARSENCTPLTVLLTALKLLLYLQTGERDIRIGTLVANRGRRETENVIGHIMNTVVLRTYLVPDISFKQLLELVRATTIAAHAHQELPYENLARVLEEEQRASRDSLFQVLLIYNLALNPTIEVPGLTFAPFDVKPVSADNHPTLSTFDLIFDVKETSTKLTGSVNYKTDAVEASVATAINKGLTDVLGIAVMNPEQCISKLAASGQVMSHSGGGV
jgi:amino acid adenylation domain-containing protein